MWFLLRVLCFVGRWLHIVLNPTTSQEVQPFGISESDLADRFDGAFIHYGDKNLASEARYAVTPYIFIKVNAEFFERTFNTFNPTYPKEVADESEFVTANSSVDLKRGRHLGEHTRPWLEHNKWGWAKSHISWDSRRLPGKLVYAEELEGQKHPRISPSNTWLLSNIAKDKKTWATFTSRFLT